MYWVRVIARDDWPTTGLDRWGLKYAPTHRRPQEGGFANHVRVDYLQATDTRRAYRTGPATLRVAALGNRLTVDPRTLTPLVLVRIQVPQPNNFNDLVREIEKFHVTITGFFAI